MQRVWLTSIRRDRPANEVYVTGTFDDWAKSVKLEKKGDGFEKKVDLPASGQKIYYKVSKSFPTLDIVASERIFP